MRAAKRAPITQTVINRMGEELRKSAEAGFTVDQCLALCCERGWQGFQHAWLLNAVQANGQGRGTGNRSGQLHANAEEARRQFHLSKQQGEVPHVGF